MQRDEGYLIEGWGGTVKATREGWGGAVVEGMGAWPDGADLEGNPLSI